MTSNPILSPKELERLRQFDSCLVSNAIERFGVRLRNEGFMHASVRCLFPQFPPMIGYAVTGRIRSATPPMTGRCYYDRMDWWKYVETIPAPRVIVLEDIDRHPGTGALFGELHAHICRALRCTGYVTNGAVRDLVGVEATGFHLFAGSVAVSHSYAHIAEFGEAVEVGGLKVKPGDLLHGDRNGVVGVPLEIAARVAGTAEEIAAEEREMIELIASGDFSLEKLEAKIRDHAERQTQHGNSSARNVWRNI